MADDKRRAPGTADSARRQPPTIDLTAKDITGAVDREASAPLKPEQPKTESKAESKPEPKPEPISAGASAPERKLALVPALLAGLGGGALVAAATMVLWLSGAMTPTSAINTSGNNDALNARLDALDKKTSDLAARPQSASGTAANNNAVSAITARLGKVEEKLEQSAANAPVGSPANAGQLAAIDNNLKALGVAVAGLNRRVDEIAANALAARDEAGATTKSLGDVRNALSELRKTVGEMPSPAGRADIEALAKRLGDIEAAAKTARQSTAQATSIGAAVRLALAASALREAVVGGNAYAAELAAVTSAGGDAAAIAALAPFADKGVPSDATLAKELLALIAPMSKAAGVDKQTAGGFLEKLQANAEKLVRVRPLEAQVGADSGADAGAVLARLEARAARNDIAGARADIDKLPPAAKQVAGTWLKTLAARDAARAAARTLSTGATRALAQP